MVFKEWLCQPKTLIVIAIKFLFGILLAAYPLRDWFLPFINYFVSSSFKNPWDYFYALQELKVFPYGPVMLYILTLGKFLAYPLQCLIGQSIILDLAGFTTIFILADLCIFFVLLKICDRNQKLVFLLYFCSPIIFYITYYHGQLDIIPVALVMLAVERLVNRKYSTSALLLGLAINAKASSFIAFPFVMLFIFKKNIKEAVKYFLIVLIAYALALYPFAMTEGFRKIVFGVSEQSWVFDLFLTYQGHELNLLIMPLLLGLLFINFGSYSRISKDMLLMFIGLAFMLLVTFISPMPGWYAWSYPFIVYAFIHYEDFPRFPVIFQTLAYYIYFCLYSESTFFDSWSILDSHWQRMGVLEVIFPWVTYDLKLDSVLFIPLVSSMFYIMYIMLVLGVRHNNLTNFRDHPHLLGIGGDSGSGKHQLVDLLRDVFGNARTLQINGDSYHKWERKNPMWSVYTHLNPKANNLFVQFEHISKISQGRSIQKVEYDHRTGNFTNFQTVNPNNFVLIVGLHPFLIPQMRKLFDFKIFLNTDQYLKEQWKIQRDTQKRGYTQSEVTKSISARAEDFEKYLLPQAKYADLIISYGAVGDNPSEIQVEYAFSSVFDCEQFVAFFNEQKHSGFCVEHDFAPDLEKQTISVRGKISSKRYKAFIEQNYEDFENYIQQNYKFENGVNGFTQLLIIYLLWQNETRRTLPDRTSL